MTQSSDEHKPKARLRCPICGAPSEHAFKPFCSHRCADVDLSRWLRGGYAIPVSEDDDEDGEVGVPAVQLPQARNGDGELH